MADVSPHMVVQYANRRAFAEGKLLLKVIFMTLTLSPHFILQQEVSIYIHCTPCSPEQLGIISSRGVTHRSIIYIYTLIFIAIVG